MFRELDEMLESFLEKNIPGNDCIICHKGKTIYRKFRGFADRNRQIPIKGNERYQIFSCSKLITCCAALQLWEKGKFSLDDELARFMPEFAEMKVRTPEGIKKAENKILIKHLFSMTAGFSYNLNSKSLRRAIDDTFGSCPTVKTITYLADEPLLFEPGTNWAYSLCHDVLAALVEVVSGVPFNDYVTDNIFRPVGMMRSTFLLPAAEYDTLIPLYRENSDGAATVELNGITHSGISPYRLGVCYASGGAGCVSSTADFNLLLGALCSGERVLKRSTIDMMSTDRLEDSFRDACMAKPPYGYGLGVRCPARGCSERTDFGWGGAAGAYFSIDPVKELTVLYMQHVTCSSVAPLRNQILALVHKGLGII